MKLYNGKKCVTKIMIRDKRSWRCEWTL